MVRPSRGRRTRRGFTAYTVGVWDVSQSLQGERGEGSAAEAKKSIGEMEN